MCDSVMSSIGTREKKRQLFLSPDSEAVPDVVETNPEATVLEDIMVVNLGVINECPGLLPEAKVNTLILM